MARRGGRGQVARAACAGVTERSVAEWDKASKVRPFSPSPAEFTLGQYSRGGLLACSFALSPLFHAFGGAGGGAGAGAAEAVLEEEPADEEPPCTPLFAFFSAARHGRALSDQPNRREPACAAPRASIHRKAKVTTAKNERP